MTWTEFISISLAVVFAVLWLYEGIAHTNTRVKMKSSLDTFDKFAKSNLEEKYELMREISRLRNEARKRRV